MAATIAAAREETGGRVVAIFQPHLFSRTQALGAEFGAALAAADVPVLLDVYPAREQAVDFPGVTGRAVAAAVADARPGHEVLWLPRFDDVLRVLPPRLRPDDLVLVLGAGDVDALGRALLAGQEPVDRLPRPEETTSPMRLPATTVKRSTGS